jgi:acyl-[acyl-carrier-protein]-phospholipid O-acyltransferase/long-chain-fatty-acid--[acyl-carrier-protein] ligase
VPNPSQGYVQLLRRQPGLAFLLAAQALSVFNDNAYKTVLIFYALAHASSPGELAWMIPTAGGLLVIPYILFSSYAGQVADRFSKRNVIITMKALEILLMALATAAVYSGHLGLMMAVLFVEGTHSTFLSPAKEGILPQMLPDADLSRQWPDATDGLLDDRGGPGGRRILGARVSCPALCASGIPHPGGAGKLSA